MKKNPTLTEAYEMWRNGVLNAQKSNPSEQEKTYTDLPASMGTCFYQGLTKREMFAIHAMQGIVVNNKTITFDDCLLLANKSVNMADALLAALETKER